MHWAVIAERRVQALPVVEISSTPTAPCVIPRSCSPTDRSALSSAAQRTLPSPDCPGSCLCGSCSPRCQLIQCLLVLVASILQQQALWHLQTPHRHHQRFQDHHLAYVRVSNAQPTTLRENRFSTTDKYVQLGPSAAARTGSG